MNNSLYYLRLFLLATSGMLLLCTIFAINPELAQRDFLRKDMLVSFYRIIIGRKCTTYGVYHPKKPFYILFTGCAAITSVRYCLNHLRQRQEPATGTFPFYSPAHYTLVYAQEYVAGTSGTPSLFHHNHHIYGDRSGHMGNL